MMADEGGYEANAARDAAWGTAWGYELAHLHALAERDAARLGLPPEKAAEATLSRYKARRAALYAAHPEVPRATLGLRVRVHELMTGRYTGPALPEYNPNFSGPARYVTVFNAAHGFTQAHVRHHAGTPDAAAYEAEITEWLRRKTAKGWTALECRMAQVFAMGELGYDGSGPGLWRGPGGGLVTGDAEPRRVRKPLRQREPGEEG